MSEVIPFPVMLEKPSRLWAMLLPLGIVAGSCILLRSATAEHRGGTAARPHELAAVDVAAAEALLAGQAPPVSSLLKVSPRPLGSLDLAAMAPTTLAMEANSEQRQPLRIGATLRDQTLYGRTTALPRLPRLMDDLARKQTRWIAEKLGYREKDKEKEIEFELWPTMNEYGRLTWVISRYRPTSEAPWQWLDSTMQRGDDADPNLVKEPRPLLPDHLSPGSRRGYISLFPDFLDAARDLYEKPRFSECVFTTADKNAALTAWRPSSELPATRAHFEHATEAERRSVFCIALPQPAKLNQTPLTLHLRMDTTGHTQFVEPIAWMEPPVEKPLPPALRQAAQSARLPNFPPSFDDDYRRDVAMLAGNQPLPSGLRLTRKNNADPHHQLEFLLDYLETRYEKLGIQTRRQRFMYRGIPQSNLIAVLPGKDSTQPIVLADHIDSAFCEDVFAQTGDRVSSAGADDNATATATLLRAAAVLRDLPREHEIWLLHLTGEEYPADDLGARQFVAELLKDKHDIGALLLLDMTGYNPKRAPEYQLNAGGLYQSGEVSMQLAALTALLSQRVAPRLKPQIRTPTDLRNYLYNTDGLIFAEGGFPVLFFNEMMDRYHTTRSGYHDTLDSLANTNLEYAASIARVAIASAAVLAQMGAPANLGP